jgi:hypothetical protein
MAVREPDDLTQDVWLQEQLLSLCRELSGVSMPV